MKANVDLIIWLERVLEDYGVSIDFYIDRLRVYCDSQTRTEELESLERATLETRRVPHHADLDRRVDLLQPKIRDLKALSKIIEGQYLINYVEVAMDFCADDPGVREDWRICLDKMLVIENATRREDERFYYVRHKASTYYAERARKFTTVLYSDRKKTRTEASVHVESRLGGKAAVRKAGITVLDDVIRFDHRRFWGGQLDLRLPVWSRVGKWLPSVGQSRQGDVKRGRKFFEGVAVLQELLAKEPSFAGALKPVSSEEVLRKWISSFMDEN